MKIRVFTGIRPRSFLLSGKPGRHSGDTGECLKNAEPRDVRNRDHDNEHEDKDLIHAVMADPEPGGFMVDVN